MSKKKIDNNLTNMMIDDLIPDVDNCRHHPEANLKAITESLKKFGQYSPLVVQKSTNKILVGNARYLVMKELGYTKINCNVLDIGDSEAKLLAIVDNRTADMAEWDYAKLTGQIKSLQELTESLEYRDVINSLNFDNFTELDNLNFSSEEIDNALFTDTKDAKVKDKILVTCPFCKEKFDYIKEVK